MPGVPEGAEGPLHLPALWDHGLPQGGLLQVQNWYVLLVAGDHQTILHHKLVSFNLYHSGSVLWIRIRMDPELLPESGSGIIVPNPAKSERAYK